MITPDPKATVDLVKLRAKTSALEGVMGVCKKRTSGTGTQTGTGTKRTIETNIEDRNAEG
jgi:hypothetical protein